jgi:RND family efflux transporter MFP subunit
MTDKTQRPVVETTSTPSGSGGPKLGRRGAYFGVGIVLVVVGALAVGGWSSYTESRNALETSRRHRDFVPAVRVAEVRDGGETISVSLPATTQAFTTANIFARASGYIDKRPADIGDRVKDGQLLAEITAAELDHQIEQAKATLELDRATLRQNQANMDLAQITWNRDKPLVAEGWTTRQQGSIDQQNLKALEAAVGVAQQNIAAQEAQLRVLNQQKTYQTVVAPFDGVVTQRNIDVGSLVQADATSGTFMFTVMQTNVIRAQVYVPQDQAVGVRPGVEAIVHIPEMPGRSFPGKVTRIATALQPDTRTLLTEIDVPNPDGDLAPGTYCTVELHIPRKGQSLIVPADAIVFDSEGLHVAVLEDGVARFRKVTVAHDLGTEVEVSTGLTKGEHVIRNPAVQLVDGSRAKAQADPIKEAEN